MLRNQPTHCGATGTSKVNRAPGKGSVYLWGAVVPIILELVLDYPEFERGDVLYPVIG